MVKQMTVEQLREKRDRKEDFVLVDVREEDENRKCKIEGSVLIPLSKFQETFTEKLKKDQEIVVHCHFGGRSQKASEFLAGQGFENVSNLTGGIDAWSVQIDPKVPRY